MGLLRSMRSWSFPTTPPPPYVTLTTPESPAEDTQPYRPSRPRRQLTRWLLTFEKQWLLAHVLSTFSCFMLMFGGSAVFVTISLDDFSEVHPAWLCGAVGMVTVAANVALSSKLWKVYLPDTSQTSEQHSTSRFIFTVVAVLGQLFLAFILGLVAYNIPLLSYRMRLLRGVANLAAIMCCISTVYDVARLWRAQRDAYDGDVYLDDEDLENGSARPNGAVRLE